MGSLPSFLNHKTMMTRSFLGGWMSQGSLTLFPTTPATFVTGTATQKETRGLIFCLFTFDSFKFPHSLKIVVMFCRLYDDVKTVEFASLWTLSRQMSRLIAKSADAVVWTRWHVFIERSWWYLWRWSTGRIKKATEMRANWESSCFTWLPRAGSKVNDFRGENPKQEKRIRHRAERRKAQEATSILFVPVAYTRSLHPLQQITFRFSIPLCFSEPFPH